MIARPTRVVLNGLKSKGAMLLGLSNMLSGACYILQSSAFLEDSTWVRQHLKSPSNIDQRSMLFFKEKCNVCGICHLDLILKRTPKDFDIVTTAELEEVQRTFSHCEIVGRQFPVCHVHVDDEVVEVSSFQTSGIRPVRNLGLSFGKPVDCDEKDQFRWRNCLRRDFTINGLMFDPYSKLVYDYMGGVDDIRKANVQTIGPASFSFIEDCARILRAIRIAAILGFRFGRETALYIKNLSYSVLRLDRAAYFFCHGFRRRDKRSNLLLFLFSNLDKLVAPNMPCHSSLCTLRSTEGPFGGSAFSLGVHNGGDLSEALSIAKRISAQHDGSFHELESQDLDLAALKEEVVEVATSVQRALTSITDEYSVSRAMANYRKAQYSDLVFIPLALYLKACKVCQCVRMGKEKGFVAKQGSKIDYKLLASGSLQEV